MNAWRLEWLRATRSHRGLILAAVYVFFGLVGPLLAKYMPELVKYASSQITIIAPEPKPEHGIVNFVDQVDQTGLIVTVVIVAGALCFDARRGLAIFYRTRAPGPFALIWPRFVAGAALAVAAYVLGTVAAWLETSVVLGELSTVRVLEGVVLEAVFLVFAVAVVAAASTVARTTLSTVGIAFGLLFLVLPIAGVIAQVAPWLPTRLASGPAALVTGAEFGAYLRPLAVSVIATVGLLALAARRARHRDL